MTHTQDLLRCPFCGATPHQNLGKVWHDQLHGDRHQDHIIKCPHLCVTMSGSDESVRSKWNRRAPAPAVPDDVAKIVTRMRMRDLFWEAGQVELLAAERGEFLAGLKAQAAELARYREALGPFAAVAEHDIGDDETDGEVFRPMQFVNRAPKLTVGDLRRARAALQPTGDA